MFQPEKVERIEWHDGNAGCQYVKDSDYDQLLALYREQAEQLKELREDVSYFNETGIRTF